MRSHTSKAKQNISTSNFSDSGSSSSQNKVKNVATWLPVPTFTCSFHYGEVFNQTRWSNRWNKVQTWTWLTKQNSKLSTKAFLSIRCSDKFQTEGVTNCSKTRNKRTASWILQLFHRSATFSKLEIGIAM